MTNSRKGFFGIAALVLGAALIIGIGAYLGLHSKTTNQTLGVAFNPAQGSPTYLSGAGLTANATSVNLTSFQTRQGAPITTANIGGIGYVTIDPGTSKEENISFTGITQNANGSAILTGVTRGLLNVYPYTSSSTLSIAHSGGATVITSNSGAFYSQFAVTGNTTTISGLYTFASSSLPSVTTDTTNAQVGSSSFNLATVGYVNSTSFAGSPNGSVTVKGIYQEATIAQVASGTNIGSTGADLIIPNRYSSLTASTSPVSVIASGTIDPSYLLNGNYTLGSTTLATTTLTSVTSTFLATNASGTIIATSSPVSYSKYISSNTATTTAGGAATSTLAVLTLPASATNTIYAVQWFTTANGTQNMTTTFQIGSSTLFTCNQTSAGSGGIFNIIAQNSTTAQLAVGVLGCSSTISTNFTTFNFASSSVWRIYGATPTAQTVNGSLSIQQF